MAEDKTVTLTLTEHEREVLLYLVNMLDYGDPLKDIGQDGDIDPRDAYAAAKTLRQKVNEAI